MSQKPLMYGITGLPLSGKNEVAQMVAQHTGRDIFDMGETVRIERRKRNIPPGKTGEFVNSQRAAYGEDAIAQMTVERIEQKPETVVVSGLRSLAEKNRFESELSARMQTIAVWCPKSERNQRMQERARPEDSDGQSLEERDMRDIENGVAEAIALSDKLVKNNTTLDRLQNRVEQIIQ